MRIGAVTKRFRGWEEAILALQPHGVVVRIFAPDDIGGTTPPNCDFFVCDAVEVYKNLPAANTILIFSQQPASFFSSFLLDTFNSLTPNGGTPPTLVLFPKNGSLDKIRDTAEMLGFAVAVGDYEGATQVGKYPVIGHDAALRELHEKIKGAFIIASEEAADAFARLLHEITVFHITPEARLKLMDE